MASAKYEATHIVYTCSAYEGCVQLRPLGSQAVVTGLGIWQPWRIQISQCEGWVSPVGIEGTREQLFAYPRIARGPSSACALRPGCRRLQPGDIPSLQNIEPYGWYFSCKAGSPSFSNSPARRHNTTGQHGVRIFLSRGRQLQRSLLWKSRFVLRQIL
jgi:hypothetical protein